MMTSNAQAHNDQNSSERLLDCLPELQHLQNLLADIEAIDYFIAREIVSAVFSDCDVQFHQGKANVVDTLFYLIIALSQAQRQGHTCLQLTEIAANTWFASTIEDNEGKEYPGYVFADLATLKQGLEALAISPDDSSLIVFEHEKLYLRRYWQFERDLAIAIRERVATVADQTIDNPAEQLALQKQVLRRLFPDVAASETDWQKVAVANALNKSFSIIAGGPGTGKTYTVTKLIAALIMQAETTLDIQLVAPTGKAAQRLSESIGAAVESFRKIDLVDDTILDAIPVTGLTLHRLLGVKVNSPNFRHDEHNPLRCDVVIVDEVSMVDLPLMTRLFRALPKDCKVILLGDCQQLPSVETGSVLADLALYENTRYSKNNVDYLQQISGEPLISDAQACDYLTYLTKSRRFQGAGGIGRLASAIIQGDSINAWQLLSQSAEQLLLSKESSLAKYILQLTQQYYLPIFSSKNLQEAYQTFQRFRILSPCKSSEGGVEYINEHVEKALQNQGCIPYSQSLYRGRPIMITQNHYKLQLFNGDIGMLWPDPDGNLKAYFPDNDGFRSVSIPRLPPFETVYAMTIHKTQGSEFDHVAMVLPQKGGARLLTRELLYTGLTRAKSHFQLFSRKREFVEGIEKQVSRCSGLGQRIR
ncbi:exodeoxyribonuclease V subunit alpha [Thalassotalea litorea]|uniref:exodeoxyribonuclease V subunit alpha n=1 Tax=Thalassotalea litorea TaxID=2020715 RepID=UPI00373675D1